MCSCSSTVVLCARDASPTRLCSPLPAVGSTTHSARLMVSITLYPFPDFRHSTVSYRPHCPPPPGGLCVPLECGAVSVLTLAVLSLKSFIVSHCKASPLSQFQIIEFLLLTCCVILYILLNPSELSFYQLKFCQAMLPL